MPYAYRITTCIICSLLFIAGIVPAAHGQSGTQDQRKTSTRQLQLLDEFHPQPGVYYYDVFLGNVRLGKVTIRTEKKGDFYEIEVKGKTRKAISSLYKIRYRGEVLISSTPVKPQSANIEQQSGKRKKEVSVAFPRENLIEVTEQQSGQGEENNTTEYSIESTSFILDPFSTLFLVRAMDWELGMMEIFDVFSGRKQYELRLACTGETTMEYEGIKRDVWVIIPQATPPDKPEEQKLADYEILLSQDDKREVLVINGKTKVGRLTAQLRKFTPLPPK